MSRLVICQKEGSTEMNAPPTNCKDVRPVSSVPCNTHPCNPVSYTHLDVYKRQVLYYCFTLVHWQLLLYTLLFLILLYMWFLFMTISLYFHYCGFFILGYGDMGVFYKSIPSASGCCLLLVSSTMSSFLLAS